MADRRGRGCKERRGKGKGRGREGRGREGRAATGAAGLMTIDLSRAGRWVRNAVGRREVR